MQIDFINVVFTVFTLIALAVPGFLLCKAKLLGESSASLFLTLFFTLVNLCLFLWAFKARNIRQI